MNTLRIRSILKSAAVVTVLLIMAVLMFAVRGPEKAYADGYKYKVTIYSGAQGTFKGGKTVWSKTYNQGEHVQISLKSLGFKLKNGSKYYARGFKISGHDNDETTGFMTMSFKAKQDVEYTVAYGLKGAMVKYIVKYVDDQGSKLSNPDTYYGMAGDKPVLAYKYIEGWTPDAYNKAKTLSKDESKNVFTFTYSKAGGEQGQTGENEEGDNGGANQGDNGGANANPANPANAGPAAPGTPQNPAGTNVDDGADTTIDDADTPTDDGNGDNDGDNDGPAQFDDQDTPTAAPGSKNMTAVIAGSIAGLLLILALILFLLKKKKNTEEAAPTDTDPEE